MEQSSTLGEGRGRANKNLRESGIDDDAPRRRTKGTSSGLQKLAKNPRGNLGSKTYDGNLNPVAFNAWRESLYNTYDAYDIYDDEEQVRAASWSLEGKAGRWWDGMVSARTYR